jgi:beta-N-acetylhexosaminidase
MKNKIKINFSKILLFTFILSLLFLSLLLPSCKKEDFEGAALSEDGTSTRMPSIDEAQSEFKSDSESTSAPSSEPTSLQTSGQNTLTLEEMIGRMIIVGFRGTEVNESSKIIKDINRYGIGGVILYDYDMPSDSPTRNILNPQQLKKLTEDLKKLTRPDLLIAIDAEGGDKNRLNEKYGFIKIKSAQEMGKESPENTFLEASLLGEELSQLGINLNLAPVVDVNINKNNLIIGKARRSFSDDPDEVYEHAAAFIDAMHRYNIITAIKHFPGHGSSTGDSHIGLTDITDTYNEEVELLPYKKLIEDGRVDIIMTAHIINRNIDPDNPATLSSVFLKEILRGRLNYNGAIISDDLQMAAITGYFDFDEAIVKAVNAGCDLLIFSNNSGNYDEDIARRAVKAIKSAINEGKITEDRIVDSYNRIKKLTK